LRPIHIQIALGFLTVSAPHLLGGVFAWATLSLAIGGCIALAIALRATQGDHKGHAKTDPVASALALMMGATIAHALPLPVSIAEWLAPAALAHTRATAGGLGVPQPTFVSFSLDPGGTYERVLFAVAVFTAFCATRLVAHGSGRTPILMTVAMSSVLIAASDLVHRAVGATHVYGLYTPELAEPRGPLLNPNNLAGFLALGFPVCLGLAAQSAAGPRWAWAVAAAVVAATNLLAGSRGGTAVLVGGALSFAALIWIRSRGLGRFVQRDRERREGTAVEQRARWRNRLGDGVLVMLSVGMAALLARLAADDFVDTDYQDLSKLDLYHAEAQLLFNSPRNALLGVGRGAFSVAFSPVSRWFARAREAESLPLQYAIEFGLPIAVILLGSAGLRVWSALRRWRSPAQLGGLVGVVAIAMQNLVDFSLELSGVALPAAVCLAAALPGMRPQPARWLRFAALRRSSIAGLTVCIVAILAFGAGAVRHDRITVERALKRHLRSHDSEAFWALFASAVRAHPADPALALLGAAQRVSERHGSAEFWLKRASHLAPASALPHLWAARYEALKGRWDPALAELRTAADLDPKKTLTGLCPWIRRAPTARTVLRVAPETGDGRVGVLDAGARCLEGVPSEAAKVDAAILMVRPTHFEARLRSTQRDLVAKRWGDVIRQAQRLHAEEPSRTEPVLLEAQALLGAGKPAEAVARLLRAPPGTQDRAAILSTLAWSQTLNKDAIGMRQTIDQMRMNGAGDARKLAQAAARLSEYERYLGNDARALKAMRDAYALVPSPNYLASSARLATSLGQTEFALNAWQQLCTQDPKNRSYCGALDALRKQGDPR